jgi:O-antigen/teichoic acid export membrane protein
MPETATLPRPPESGLRRILANLAHLLGGKAVAGLLSLVYLVMATHRLGATDYGILVLVNAHAVLIGSVVAFSGFHGVVRYGAIALAAGDRPGFARLVRFMALIELGCGLLAILVAAVLAPIVGPHLGWSPRTIALATFYSLAVVGTVRATPQGVLQIAGRFDLLGIHQAVSPVVRLAGVLGLWWWGAGLYGFITVWLASAIAEGVAMWLLALPSWRRLTSGEGWIGPWRGAGGDGFVRFILVTNADITIRELAPNLAPLTVGWLLGPAAAGLLALTQRATSLLAQPTVLLGHASYSVLAEQVAHGRIASLRHTVLRSAGLALLVALPIVAALAIGGDHLLTLLGGHSFAGGTLLLVLVAIGRAAGLAGAPLASGLTALGRPQRSMNVGLVTNLAFYPLLPVLLWTAGPDGAGWHAALQGLAALAALAVLFRRDIRDAA